MARGEGKTQAHECTAIVVNIFRDCRTYMSPNVTSVSHYRRAELAEAKEKSKALQWAGHTVVPVVTAIVVLADEG